jgi:O-antigen/teichoic acid export membrane protein
MDYYRARHEAIKFMITGLISAGILIITSYIFLYVLRMGIMGALWAKIATYTIILLPISFDIFSRTGVRISFSLLPTLARFGFPLVFSMSSELVITGASVYFLSLFSGLEAVAIYSLGLKLAMALGIILILPFHMSFQPFIFASLDNPNVKKQMSQLLTYLVLAISGASFCILFGSRLLLPYIAPPAYSSAYNVILLLLPGMAFIGIYYFAETLLIAARKTYIIGFTMTIFAILCVVLNYSLIPALGWYGAIIASNVCFVLIGSILLIIGIKKFPTPIEWERICTAAGLLIFLLFVFFMVRNANLILFSVITLSAALGGVLMLFGFHFFHNDEKLLIKKLFLNYGR